MDSTLKVDQRFTCNGVVARSFSASVRGIVLEPLLDASNRVHDLLSLVVFMRLADPKRTFEEVYTQQGNPV
eukprot:4168802-Amphidinium_carterae.1